MKKLITDEGIVRQMLKDHIDDPLYVKCLVETHQKFSNITVEPDTIKQIVIDWCMESDMTLGMSNTIYISSTNHSLYELVMYAYRNYDECIKRLNAAEKRINRLERDMFDGVTDSDLEKCRTIYQKIFRNSSRPNSGTLSIDDFIVRVALTDLIEEMLPQVEIEIDQVVDYVECIMRMAIDEDDTIRHGSYVMFKMFTGGSIYDFIYAIGRQLGIPEAVPCKNM